MFQRFLDFVESKDLFTKDDKLLLALSGGADSVSLFHLLRESDFSFSVAHVNFSLRGEESDADCSFVVSLCKEYEIDYFIKDVPESYWKKGMNIQAEAREIRYSFFKDLAEEYTFTKILSAHHKEDNVETILMNISRGTGIKGLKGMEAKRDMLVRPLLFTERKEIENYLNEKKLTWRNDSSNESNKYKRNRFRNEIIPLLKKENPSLLEAIDRMIENITNVEEVYMEAFKSFCINNIKREGAHVKVDKTNPLHLKRYLYEYLKDFGFNRDQVNDIIKTLPKVGKQFESNTHILLIDRSDLVLLIKEERNDDVLEIVENASALLHPLVLKFYGSNFFKKDGNSKLAQFDKSKLSFPLKLRIWQDGDRIQPLGMKGSKKVSDVLIDKKVSSAAKKNIMVLLSGDEIIWIVDCMISEKVKVEDDTKEIWCVELKKA